MNAAEIGRRTAAGVSSFQRSPARKAEAAREYARSLGSSTEPRRKGGSVGKKRKKSSSAAHHRRAGGGPVGHKASCRCAVCKGMRRTKTRR